MNFSSLFFNTVACYDDDERESMQCIIGRRESAK